jgi:hypothetical protein
VSEAVGALDRGWQLVANDGSDHRASFRASGRPVLTTLLHGACQFVYDFDNVPAEPANGQSQSSMPADFMCKSGLPPF